LYAEKDVNTLHLFFLALESRLVGFLWPADLWNHLGFLRGLSEWPRMPDYGERFNEQRILQTKAWPHHSFEGEAEGNCNPWKDGDSESPCLTDLSAFT
jgi:hypothetical protein